MIYQITLVLFSIASFLSALFAYNKVEIPFTQKTYNTHITQQWDDADINNTIASSSTLHHQAYSNYPTAKSSLGEYIKFDQERTLQDWERIELK